MNIPDPQLCLWVLEFQHSPGSCLPDILSACCRVQRVQGARVHMQDDRQEQQPLHIRLKSGLERTEKLRLESTVMTQRFYRCESHVTTANLEGHNTDSSVVISDPVGSDTFQISRIRISDVRTFYSSPVQFLDTRNQRLFIKFRFLVSKERRFVLNTQPSHTGRMICHR